MCQRFYVNKTIVLVPTHLPVRFVGTITRNNRCTSVCRMQMPARDKLQRNCNGSKSHNAIQIRTRHGMLGTLFSCLRKNLPGSGHGNACIGEGRARIVGRGLPVRPAAPVLHGWPGSTVGIIQVALRRVLHMTLRQSVVAPAAHGLLLLLPPIFRLHRSPSRVRWRHRSTIDRGR